MKEPTQEKLNQDRKDGLRPSALICCVHNGKVLFLNKKEYGLWMFPQCGIDNGETPEEAIVREMIEELGKDFVKNIEKEFVYFGEDVIDFPEKRHGIADLKTDEGDEVVMKGKKFYFYAVAVIDEKLDIEKTEFDDFFWLPYETANALAGKIYQVNKKRVTEKSIELLKEMGLIS